MKNQKAYQQGIDACINSENYDSNPYEPSSQDHEDWNEGFADQFNKELDEDEADINDLNN